MVQLWQTFHANVMGTTHSRFGHSRLVDFTGGRGGRGGCWQEQQNVVCDVVRACGVLLGG